MLGVVELASFTRFTPIQLAFLEQLAETLGISVNAIIANSRTDALLEESQRLTAELQTRLVRTPGAPRRAAAVQRGPGGQGRAARRPEAGHRGEEHRDRARQGGDRRTGQASLPRLAVQVAVPRQHVARAAHPAEQPAILARLLAQNPGGTSRPSRSSTRTSSTPPARPAAAHQRHPRPVQGGGGPDGHPGRTVRRCRADRGRPGHVPAADRGEGPRLRGRRRRRTPRRRLVTDRQRLRQVLGNLLSNAVKFTASGRVTLRVGAGPGPAASTAARWSTFSVTDTGIGIAPENLAVIFGRVPAGRRHAEPAVRRHRARPVDRQRGRRACSAATITATASSAGAARSPCTVPRALPESPAATAPDAAPGRRVTVPGPGPPDALPRPGLRPASGSAPPDTARPSRARRATALPRLGRSWRTRRRAPAAGAGGAPRAACSRCWPTAPPPTWPTCSLPVQVQTVTRPDEAVDQLRSAPHQCVVLDLGLPGSAAFTFLDLLRDEPALSGLPVLAHTRRLPRPGPAGPIPAGRAPADRLRAGGGAGGAAAVPGRSARAHRAVPVGGAHRSGR